MAAQELEDLTLNIDKDRMSAVLTIPAGLDLGEIGVELCVSQMESAGLHVDKESNAAIEIAVSDHLADPSSPHHITVEGRPPIHGKDGYLALTDELDASKSTEDTTPVDHYARSPFVLISPSQHLGSVVPPEDGEDGLDVLGTVVAAKPGKSCPLKVDDSILLDAQGNLTAQCSGTLEVAGNAIKINKVLAVPHYVDFETGNINFDGDVEIARGIRDKFSVTATGAVVIQGLAEGASIEAGTDLTLAAGIAAKGIGLLKVGRDCRAKYLDQVRAQIGHDLAVDREIINCELMVGGAIQSPSSALIGGESHVFGAAEVKEIGSSAGTQTVLHIGSSPKHDAMRKRAWTKMAELQFQIDSCSSRMSVINAAGKNMTAKAKEEVTELLCTQMDIQGKKDELQKFCDSLQAYYNASQKVMFTATGVIYRGSVLVVGDLAYTFKQDLRGPITVCFDSHNDVCWQRQAGDPPSSCREIADQSSWNLN